MGTLSAQESQGHSPGIEITYILVQAFTNASSLSIPAKKFCAALKHSHLTACLPPGQGLVLFGDPFLCLDYLSCLLNVSLILQSQDFGNQKLYQVFPPYKRSQLNQF